MICILFVKAAKAPQSINACMAHCARIPAAREAGAHRNNMEGHAVLAARGSRIRHQRINTAFYYAASEEKSIRAITRYEPTLAATRQRRALYRATTRTHTVARTAIRLVYGSATRHCLGGNRAS